MNIHFYLKRLVCGLTLITTLSEAQDLTLESLTLNQSVVSTEGSLHAFTKITNRGTNQAEASKLGFYVSTDSTLSAEDRLVAEVAIASLANNDSDTATTSLLLGSMYGPGYYYLLGFADYNNQLEESIEKNNISKVAFSIAAPAPDLTITSFYSYNSTFVSGEVFQGVATITNLENNNAPESYVGYYFSEDSVIDGQDSFLGANYLYGIADSSSATAYSYFSLPNFVQPGNYYVIAIADYPGNLSETNEQNNARAFSILINEEIVDLTVSSFVSLTDSVGSGISNVAAGERLQTYSSLYNAGNSFLYNVNTGYYLSADSIFDLTDTFLSGSYLGFLSSGAYAYDAPNLTIPAGTSPGIYFLLAVGDYSFQINETFENNNVRPLKINITPASVDLSFLYFNVSQTSVAKNSFFEVSVNELNNGSSVAGPHTIRYLLSTDTISSANDRFLGENNAYDIYPGSYSYFNQSLYLSDSIANGNYYLIAVADYYNTVTEQNETNNIAYVALKVSDPFVDLSLSIAPDTLSAVAGNYATFTSIETNSGNQYADYHYNGYYLSLDTLYDETDRLLQSEFMSAVYAGSTQTTYLNVYIPTDAPLGKYYLLGATDYTGFIPESNENNNSAVASLSIIPSSVDLKPVFVDSTLNTVAQGGTISPLLIEYNNGSNYASTHYIGYYLSRDTTVDNLDTFLTYQYAYEVSGYGYNYVYPSINLPKDSVGTYYLIAVSDFYNQITESNESNNATSIALLIRPSNTDLSISGLSVSPTVASPGEYLYVSLFENNLGTEYAGYHNIGYFVSIDSTYDGNDYFVGSNGYYEVYPGSSQEVSAYLNVPYLTDGNYYFIAVADYQNQVSEYNERNNYSSIGFRIQNNGVDLTPSYLSVSNLNPSAGSFLYTTSIEANNGNVGATSHHVGYFLSADSVYSTNDRYLLTSYVASLTSANTIQLNPALYLPSTISDGVYYLLAYADYGNSVNETNENNNVRALRITVGNVVTVNEVDLSLSFVNVSSEVTVGQYFLANFAESNVGTALAGPHTIGFYLSNDTLLDNSDNSVGSYYVNGLSAGSTVYDSISLIIPSYVSSGYYYLIAAADDGNFVGETYEYNNVQSTFIYVNQGVILGLGRGSDKAHSFVIYPNPSSGTFTFNNLQDVEEVQVCDMNGTVLVKKTISSITENTLNVSELSSGVYVVKTIAEGKETSVQKLIIAK